MKHKRAVRSTEAGCACDSGRSYAQCCGPIHEGARAPADAVEAMRARFCALSIGNVDYVWRSLHAEHDDRALGEKALRAAFAAQAKVARFRGFRLLDHRDKDAHGIAQVLFAADLVQPGRTRTVVELASFVEEDGVLRYIAGVSRPAEQLSHHVQDLTIDHWDCGHGRAH